MDLSLDEEVNTAIERSYVDVTELGVVHVHGTSKPGSKYSLTLDDVVGSWASDKSQSSTHKKLEDCTST